MYPTCGQDIFGCRNLKMKTLVLPAKMAKMGQIQAAAHPLSLL